MLRRFYARRGGAARTRRFSLTARAAMRKNTTMFDRVKLFLRRHPSVRDALLWGIPAFAVALALRACLLSYIPLAYWGSDSRSYFDFAYKLHVEHYISLVEKRRFLYPIFVGLVTLLPG